MSPFTSDCWFLTGPTGAGKSEAALDVAERLGAEIVAMDSMTLYRGMDIGTSKPTHNQRASIPHHLLDVLDPWESATVAWYLQRAQRVCAGIRARGKRPMFVGGTPLYLKTCLRGLCDGPGADAELRRRLEAESPQHLHLRLQSCDPKAAERIRPGDLRRLVRALEVFELTGQPISAWQQEFDRPADPAPPAACLVRPRAEMYRRLNQRVLGMLQNGWIEEVRTLLDAPQPLGREPAQAVGIREIAQYLRGEMGYEQMAERVQTRSRQLCKRQMTWFRHLPECRFMETCESESVDLLRERLTRFFDAAWVRETGLPE